MWSVVTATRRPYQTILPWIKRFRRKEESKSNREPNAINNNINEDELADMLSASRIENLLQIDVYLTRDAYIMYVPLTYTSAPTSLTILVIMPTARLLESVQWNANFEEKFLSWRNVLSPWDYILQVMIWEPNVDRWNLQRRFRCDKGEEVRNLYKQLRDTVLDGAAATAHTESSTANANLWHVDRPHQWRFFYYVFWFFGLNVHHNNFKVGYFGKSEVTLCIKIE